MRPAHDGQLITILADAVPNRWFANLASLAKSADDFSKEFSPPAVSYKTHRIAGMRLSRQAWTAIRKGGGLLRL
jgi:hypothetical protein